MRQDSFLNALCETRTLVTVYLVNGMKLTGTIESFDRFSIQLKGAATQFIYKSAISALVPARDVPATRTADSREP
jgi:host factor-I protein